jgi:hypothetical protein
MNTFPKAIFLALAATAATSSAHTLGGSAGLRAQIQAAETDECMPNERPQIQNKSANKTRFRFNFKDSDAVCADAINIGYEYGGFDDVQDTDKCADMCVNDTPTELANLLRGFNYDCGNMVCQCLYDEGTMDSDNAGGFDTSNYQTRSRKGQGSISRTVQDDAGIVSRWSGRNSRRKGLSFSTICMHCWPLTRTRCPKVVKESSGM